MNRQQTEYAFIIFVLAVISTLFLVSDAGLNNSAGSAADQVTEPEVHLISPSDAITLRTTEPTFTYELTNADYGVCSVIVNGKTINRTKVQQTTDGTATGQATAELPPGKHTWKVECTLPSRETVSSTLWDITIKPDAEPDAQLPPTPEDPGNVNEITGQVTGGTGDTKGLTGLIIAMIGIAAVIWGINLSYRS